ncbi:MAG: hypothetical protein ACTHKB_11545 [Burkholderiaceae bacterium]
MKPEQHAQDFYLFVAYIDPLGQVVETREQFDALPVEERERLARLVIESNPVTLH